MIVPENTKIRGVRIRTPLLKPVMQLINKRGTIVAYTPQCFSPMISLYRFSSVSPAALSDPVRSRSKSPFKNKDIVYKSIPDDSLNYV